MLLESQNTQRQADLQKKAAEYSKLRNDLLVRLGVVHHHHLAAQ